MVFKLLNWFLFGFQCVLQVSREESVNEVTIYPKKLWPNYVKKLTERKMMAGKKMEHLIADYIRSDNYAEGSKQGVGALIDI